MRNLVINCNVSVKDSFDEEKVKDVEYEVYIRYQLNGKYAITEEEMQRLSRIYNSDCYK